MHRRRARALFSFTYPCPRRLREIVQMSLIEREPPQKIAQIWEEYHRHRPDNVATALNRDHHEALFRNLKRAPMFLFPVKRGGGHFNLVCQKQDNSVLFTFMEEYKRKGLFAEPYMILTFFEELLAAKSLSLVRGDILEARLSRAEGQRLLGHLLSFYLTADLFERFVVPFNGDQQSFDYAAFCKAMEIESS